MDTPDSPPTGAAPCRSIQDLADRLIAAWRGGPPLGVGAIGDVLGVHDDCYTVQRLVAAANGEVGGFKVAHKPGQADIMAPIPRSRVRPSPARFGRDELTLIGIELEVGFLITDPLPDPADPDFETRARTAVAAVAAMEIVDSRLDDFEAAGPLAKLADMQSNAGLVVGTPRPDWNDLDLSNPVARLELGETIVLDGPAQVPGGDPFGNFLVLARMISGHCGGLQPGQVVITGSLNGLPFVERGTQVRGRIEGLGEIAVEFPR